MAYHDARKIKEKLEAEDRRAIAEADALGLTMGGDDQEEEVPATDDASRDTSAE
jgi:DNA-directed RNA polymerase subunit beta'